MVKNAKTLPEDSDLAGGVHDTMALPPERTDSGERARLASVKSPVELGEVVNGKYRIEGVIGEGGVGIVVSAQHLELDERVALKFLKAEALTDPGLVGRFAREAKAAVSIKSEHVARILDVGTLDRLGVPFIVMEYLDGTDLRTALQLYGRFTVSDTAEYALHVCEALAMAHAKGIVHRDIKPDNLFLTANAQMPEMKSVKVLDFGISKAALTGSVFRQDLPLVTTMHLMGTPLYMSPEQIRATSGADARSDIWSLGMVMYEMLVGVTAFKGASLTELCAAILERDVQPLLAQRPEIPVELARAVERCLVKNPDARFQNVAELAQAILPFAPKRARSCAERAISVLRACGIAEASLTIQSVAPPPLSDRTSATDHGGDLGIPKLSFAVHTDPPPVVTRTRSRTAFFLGAAVVAVGVGALGASWTRQAASRNPTATPSATAAAMATEHKLVPPVVPASAEPAAVVPAVSHDVAPPSSPVVTATPSNPATSQPLREEERVATPATVAPSPPHAGPASPTQVAPPRGKAPAPKTGAPRRASAGASDNDPDLGY